MDKNVRNLLITAVVSVIVGIIMGIGVVAPSVEQPNIGENQMIINTDTPETMELCIDWSMETEARLAVAHAAYESCTQLREHKKAELDECIIQRDSWENGFYDAVDVVESSQAQTATAMALVDKCILELEDTVRYEGSIQ